MKNLKSGGRHDAALNRAEREKAKTDDQMELIELEMMELVDEYPDELLKEYD